VLCKNLNLNVSAFDNIPPNELFIFPGTPAPTDITKQNVTGTAGIIPQASSFSYHFSEQKAMEVAGGSVKIINPTNFPIAAKFSAALVTVKPGAIREIHWHTTSD
jgi:oxalate decarboxylase/phosphoglucose isomerase-like protein (cupin superfamily)